MTTTAPDAGGDRPTGVALFDDGRWAVRYQRRLPHPPAKVWRALTESEHLVQWMPCDIVGERRAGAEIELPFRASSRERYEIPEDEAVLHGEIRVWDPPTVFEWTWETDVLRWELEPDGEHTLLTFTTWLGDDADVASGAAAGYHVCLDVLATLLDTGVAPEISDDEMARWQARYAELVASAAS